MWYSNRGNWNNLHREGRKEERLTDGIWPEGRQGRLECSAQGKVSFDEGTLLAEKKKGEDLEKHKVRGPHEGVSLIFFNVYFWRRERNRVEKGQRERETESETGSRLWAVSTAPDMGLKLMNFEIMTWAEVRHLTAWATPAPWSSPSLNKKASPAVLESMDGFEVVLLSKCSEQWAC